MHRLLQGGLLILSSCCLSITPGEPMSSGTGSSTGSGSTGTSGGLLGCGTTGGAVSLPPGPCGPGTSWVGDTCVVSCAAPVSSYYGANNTCLLPDGGFGTCADGACLVPGDPANCGGLGLVCPAPWSCLTSGISSYCEGFHGGTSSSFSCDAGTCPASAPTCVPYAGCVGACNACDDNRSCAPDDGGGPGFCCGGACLTWGSDPDHCAGCGLRCPEGTFCRGASCSPEESCLNQPRGFCGLSDGGGGFCCAGQCTDLSLSCEPATSCGGAIDGTVCTLDDGGGGGDSDACCGERCTDLTTSSDHCGGCGVACGPDAFCAFGTCKQLLDCARGGVSVDPDEQGDCLTDGGLVGSCCGSSCIDFRRDPLNCGFCGQACPVGASCGPYCPMGETCRRELDYVIECLNDAGQPLKCGGAVACPAGSGCVSGNCLSPTCDGSRAFCAHGGGYGVCCGTECTAEDGLECGGPCPSGAVPNSGAGGNCALPDGGNACGPGAICPAGTFCSLAAGQCVPLNSCAPSFQTPYFDDCFPGPAAGGSCCGDACVDLGQDPNNCGGCGVICSTGVCAGFPESGQWPLCLPPGPTTDCATSCPAGSVCLYGQCINGVSQSFQYDFCLAEDGTIGITCNPGVCAHPRDDPQNCGSCGNACGPGQACIAGSCTGRPGCGIGREGFFCNLDAGPSFACCPSIGCTDTTTDPKNCGSCGTQCPPGGTCVAGSCV